MDIVESLLMTVAIVILLAALVGIIITCLAEPAIIIPIVLFFALWYAIHCWGNR